MSWIMGWRFPVALAGSRQVSSSLARPSRLGSGNNKVSLAARDLPSRCCEPGCREPHCHYESSAVSPCFLFGFPPWHPSSTCPTPSPLPSCHFSSTLHLRPPVKKLTPRLGKLYDLLSPVCCPQPLTDGAGSRIEPPHVPSRLLKSKGI